MLSEREQAALLDIERRLRADDPDFEQSFRALDAVTPARPAKRPRITSVAIVAAASMAVVMLLIGSPTGALPYAVIAVLVWAVRDLPDATAKRKHGE